MTLVKKHSNLKWFGPKTRVGAFFVTKTAKTLPLLLKYTTLNPSSLASNARAALKRMPDCPFFERVNTQKKTFSHLKISQLGPNAGVKRLSYERVCCWVGETGVYP